MQKERLADADLARQMIGNKKGLYNVAINRGYYLPTINSKIITEEYLMELLKENVFYVPLSEIRIAHLKDTNIKKSKLTQKS